MSIISEALRRAEAEKKQEQKKHNSTTKKSNQVFRSILSLGCIALITGCIFYTRYNLSSDRSLQIAQSSPTEKDVANSIVTNPQSPAQIENHPLRSTSTGLAQLAIESKNVALLPPNTPSAGQLITTKQFPKINGIIAWGDEKNVLIGDEILREGQEWNDFKVEKIIEKGVYFRRANEQELRFIEA